MMGGHKKRFNYKTAFGLVKKKEGKKNTGYLKLRKIVVKSCKDVYTLYVFLERGDNDEARA